MPSSMRREEVSRESAIELARGVAAEAYGDLSHFEADIEARGSNWIVTFTNEHALMDGESRHFEVWIHKLTAESRLYKGR